MRDKLGGLYVLTCTPFKDNFDLDLEGIKENVGFLLDNGINREVGILVPGATNTVTAVTEAYDATSPMLHISGIELGDGRYGYFHGVDDPDFL